MVSRPSSFEGDLVDLFIFFMFHSKGINKSRVVLITVFKHLTSEYLTFENPFSLQKDLTLWSLSLGYSPMVAL
jgi:hypothetical protein